MSRKRIIAMWLLYRRLRLGRKQRVLKYWMNPINERRNVMGTFNSLFEDLLANENTLFPSVFCSIPTSIQFLGFIP